MRSCDGTRHATLASRRRRPSNAVQVRIWERPESPARDLSRPSVGVAEPRSKSGFWQCARGRVLGMPHLGMRVWIRMLGGRKGWVGGSDGGKFRIGRPGARVFLCRIPHQGRRRCGLGHQGRRSRVCWVLFSRTRVDGFGHPGSTDAPGVSRPSSDDPGARKTRHIQIRRPWCGILQRNTRLQASDSEFSSERSVA